MSRPYVYACCIMLSAALCHGVSAADFRIDTRVYIDDEESPAYQTATLFQRGVVYDFLGGSAGEITIYDPRVRRFTLLDGQRKVKTNIDEDVLLQFVAGVQVRAQDHKNSTVREAAEPSFTATYDERMHRLTLTGRHLDYVAQADGPGFPSPEAARDYFNFIDMYTRLNATRVGAMPPQARLELNQALAEHEMLPTSIERTLRSGFGLRGKSTVVRSEHTTAWRLLRVDQDMIDQASQNRADFTAVSFGEYRELGSKPKQD